MSQTIDSCSHDEIVKNQVNVRELLRFCSRSHYLMDVDLVRVEHDFQDKISIRH